MLLFAGSLATPGRGAGYPYRDIGAKGSSRRCAATIPSSASHLWTKELEVYAGGLNFSRPFATPSLNLVGHRMSPSLQDWGLGGDRSAHASFSDPWQRVVTELGRARGIPSVASDRIQPRLTGEALLFRREPFLQTALACDLRA